MGRRGVPSLEDVSAVIADIHGAGGDAAEWSTALNRVGTLFDARGVSVWMQNASRDIRFVHTSPQSEESTKAYFEYYVRLDKLLPAVIRAPAFKILTIDTVTTRSEHVRGEFYTDFVQRHGHGDCMQARLFDGPDYGGWVAITSTERVSVFADEQIRLLRLLLPHLRQAMQTHVSMARLGLKRDVALEVLDRLSHGVLITDDQARVIYANDAADMMLRKADGIGVRGTERRLRAATPHQTSALRRLIAEAAAHDPALCEGAHGGALRVDRAAGSPLLLHVAPVKAEAAWNVSPRPAALVLIGTAEQQQKPASAGHLRALYDLTPTESAVACRIAEGQGTRCAAEALGIAPSTLRWHLQRVFEKTGTSRQAELVRLIERLPGSCMVAKTTEPIGRANLFSACCPEVCRRRH